MAKTMNCLSLVLLSFVLAAQRQDVVGDADACNRRYMRRLNGKCYYFSVKKLNWFGALNNCLRKGLVLADVKTPKDFTAVVTFLASKGNSDDFWFSGNDLYHEGRYQYISNGRLVKYFSNNSMLSPSTSSDCDDCLEIRIREDKTLVTYDSCREPQYFICSERYCDEDQITKKKPRHHSHEHLHHFHHDIGPENDDDADVEEGFDNNNSEAEANSADKAGPNKESEGGVAGGDFANSDEHTTPEYTEEKVNAAGASTTPSAAEDHASTAPPSEGNEAATTAASGSEATTAAAAAEGNAVETTKAPATGEAEPPATTAAAPAEAEALATTAAPAATEAPAT